MIEPPNAILEFVITCSCMVFGAQQWVGCLQATWLKQDMIHELVDVSYDVFVVLN
jgi:hypothetical protein